MGKEEYMREAIRLSIENVRLGKGGPFAAIIVKDGHIIATGSNLVTSQFDPTAHAEITAIRNACKTLKDFQLHGCEIYSSCEPCPMCLGAIYWARPEGLYYANSQADAAAIGFDDSYIYQEIALPIHQRRLAQQQLLRQEALEAFRLWQEKEDKKVY